MSTTHDVDRVLATWFAADARETAPVGLVEAITVATATTRRRPAWLPVDRRLPALPRVPMAVRLVALAALLIALAIAMLVVTGSQPRVPPPFGLAKPGLFAMSVDGNIVTADQDGSVQKMLTGDGAVNTNPMFSRDGTQLAFWSWAPKSNVSELVVMGVDGSRRRTIARVEFTEQTYDFRELPSDEPDLKSLIYAIIYDRRPAFDWSPDGRFIAYSVSDVNRSQVYVARTDGSGSGPVGDPALNGAFPAWSPDGSLIAFAGGATDAARGVYLMRPDGSVLGKISTASGWADAFSATWSPDGRRLAFLADDGDSSLWLVDVTGLNEHKIDEADHLGAPAWAPDGKRLAWTHLPADLSQPAEYRVVDADGNNVRQFPLPAATQVELAWDTDAPFMNWSADGKYLIGVLTPDGANVDRLIQLDPDSGESQIIAAPGLRAWTQQRLAP